MVYFCVECNSELTKRSRGPSPSRCESCKRKRASELRKKPERKEKERETMRVWNKNNRHRINYLRQKRRKANPEKEKEKRRNEKLRCYYNISPDDYSRLLAIQNGCCAICGSTHHYGNKKSSHFQIDHDHTTGDVRGLLCAKCNRGLGLLGDSESSILKVLNYLRGNHAKKFARS